MGACEAHLEAARSQLAKAEVELKARQKQVEEQAKLADAKLNTGLAFSARDEGLELKLEPTLLPPPLFTSLEAWRKTLRVGSMLDARDCNHKWYESIVVTPDLTSRKIQKAFDKHSQVL